MKNLLLNINSNLSEPLLPISSSSNSINNLNTSNTYSFKVIIDKLNYEILNNNNRKQILNNINAYLPSSLGTVGICGVSGAGKTTLLNILSGNKQDGLYGKINIIKENNKQK